MDGKYYDYQPILTIRGGYDGEEHGVLPNNPPRKTTTSSTGSATYNYYFRDSNSPSSWSGAQKNGNSSRVVANITDSWTVTIDDNNVMTVRVTTTVNSIQRDDIRGNPNNAGNYLRDMEIRRNEGGAVLWSKNGDAINSPHPILSTPLQLGTETYTLRPGGTQTFRASIYMTSHVSGFAWTDDYTDYIWAGIRFFNDLKDDYRPGKIWNGREWLSHNRSAGARNTRTTSGWQEHRTEDAPTGTGNPPSIYHDGRWYNQRRIGNQ